MARGTAALRQLLKSKKIVHHLVFSVLAVIFIGGLIFFNAGVKKTPLRADNGTTFEKAKVVQVIQDNSQFEENGEFAGNQLVKVQILSGEHNREFCEAQNPNSYLAGTYCTVGTPVIIMASQKDGMLTGSVYSYDRGFVLWAMIAFFILVLCLIGGKKGIASSVALILTFTCIIFLYLPMLYIGVSPFSAAVMICILTTFVTMVLIGGWTVKSISAILGTIAGVLVAGLFAFAFGALTHISGFNVQEIESLIYVGNNSNLEISEIMFSGILIASLGAVMDVSMSIASTISELHLLNPNMNKKQLCRSGINVGRDMMGTMSNTLILAFAGTSVNTIIILYAYNMPYLQLMSQYEIGIEILRGISGSLGVIATVPFVSVISSFLLTRKKLLYQNNQ